MLVLAGGAFVWFVPTMIALLRRVHGLGMVVMINLLSLLLPIPGWIGAMYAAFVMPRRTPAQLRHSRLADQTVHNRAGHQRTVRELMCFSSVGLG
jgi:hypothetical protein